MKLFSVVALLAVLSVALAATAPELAEVDHAKTCVKVKTVTSVMGTSATCTKSPRLRNMITFEITIPPFFFKIKVTLKCFKPNRARRVAKRVLKCVKVFLKRCRCVPDAEKSTCVMSQINTCAPQAQKEILM